jgi:zinc/manganese transport system substrate-binding protein
LRAICKLVTVFICINRGSRRPEEGLTMLPRRGSLAAALVVSAGLLATACSASSASPDAPGGQVVAVGAENQYANVIGQVGGKYVRATAVESNPNTDPHAFEASPSVAQAVSAAQLVVQNGSPC